MINKENCKEITVEDQYNLKDNFHKVSDLLLIVSNLKIDLDVFLIVLKAIKEYTDIVRYELHGAVNFMVLNFKDFASKIEFDKIINTFYQNLLDKEKDNIYIKSPFIIAEFQEARNNNPDSTIPGFKIRTMFEKDKNSQKFHILKESLEITHFKRENDQMICKKPSIVVKYTEKILGDKNTKETSISSRVLNAPIKIICEFEDKDTYIRLNTFKIYQRFSKLSILSNDNLIQEIKFKNFYLQSHENKILETFENFCASQNETDEIIPTKKIYEKLKDNVFLFLKPGFSLFYEDLYKKYDFISSDFVFINENVKTFSFEVQEGSVMKKYKDIFDNVLRLIPKLCEKYKIYYFDYIEERENNYKKNTFFWQRSISDNFSEVVSFRKRKIEDLSIDEKIKNIDEIFILIENVKDIENSLYIHLNVRKVIYEFFKTSYNNILKKKFEELIRNSFYINRLKLTRSFNRDLKTDLVKIFEIYIDNIKKCRDAFSFKEIIFNNLKNIRCTRSYLIKISKALVPEFSLNNRNDLEVLVCYIFKINEHINQEILLYLRRISTKVYFELNYFTSGYYRFKDYEHLQSEIDEKIAKKYDVKYKGW